MNKTALKNFAINARKELIEKVKAKAYKIGITEENIKKAQIESSDVIYIDGKQLDANEKKHREKLISRIKEIGYKQLVEEVAYTWFNRFTALRFMEVNNYLPTKVRVLSSSNPNSSEPDIIKEALSVDLDIDKEWVYERKINNNTEELFKYLVIKQCNSLNNVLPFMFETIDDYNEILFPEGLLSKNSFLHEMSDVTAIPESDWEQVEVIGWLYQYYISDEKDRVFKGKTKFKAEEIPYATQLFTPDWIVRYMVQNSLGRYWIELHSEHKSLVDGWEFFLDNEERESDFEEKLSPYINKEMNVEDIKCFDPAMGSGHILVYMFDVLYEIYSKCGYLEREIPKLIIENNLFGLDIDDRAYQLACFSIVMKAMEYNQRFFRIIEKEGLKLNLASIQESNKLTDEHIAYIAGNSVGTEFETIKEFCEQFKEAKTIGSLIKVGSFPQHFLEERLEFIKEQPIDDLFKIDIREKSIALFLQLIRQAKIMHNQYDVLVTNPPYMGSKNMNSVLNNFLGKYYPDSKGDLFASFMEIDHYLKSYSFYGCINQHSWMFLSSYKNLRLKIIADKSIDSMLHLGSRTFEEIGGEVVQSSAFIIRNVFIQNRKGIYLRLIDENTAKEKKDKTLDAVQNPNVLYRYMFDQKRFVDIPGSPIAYWVSEELVENFKKGEPISEIASPRIGLQTSDNNRFTRFWFEVCNDKLLFDAQDITSAMESNKKWFPFSKGGEYRKWYGNNDFVVNWENDGEEIKSYAASLYKNYTRTVKNINFYFKKAITWSKISTGDIAFRYKPNGHIFADAGPSIFSDDYLDYLHGFCNSIVALKIANTLSPTLNYEVGHIASFPILRSTIKKELIESIVKMNIDISKKDWDFYEISWDFDRHPLLTFSSPTIKTAFNKFDHFTNSQFEKLRINEEQLNSIFIEIYGLQNEISPRVNNIDVTIRKADLTYDIKSFISYVLGCSFGRYSLDENGLIYAGGKFSPARYKMFPAVEDNIIPILSDVYFEDDIVTRFVEFVEVTFGKETLRENLEFIAGAIGRKDKETVVDTIRRYFINDFYKDHLQIYKKRPIYWLFTSGKQKAFNCLIYMHRYERSTLSRIRTDYLHELQIRMDAEKKALLDIINADGITKETANAKKELKSLDLKIEELRAYDEKLHHMADMQIDIDLDDGVAVNYAKFEGLLAPIK
ncbi:SAM-dependent methyltransferase [Paenibacillus odorifer]|uniref:site-specific DNA-methyltransferase (adenine-specific) n=1 Tax=Paenibacillus odorifer TaxID=189426 RepID=A0A1R0XDR3_9BACL|nr:MULTISPECIES: BREX-1 system adenine-specific DNA-methyltransferase PglX [Paenibacillus]ETT45419.1 putative restriction enzyme [Paenibacillus sp. FSL H8-237]OMD33219.1 restriction endonuclease [Paenibacillus odorifer]OME59698.1 SAM-dependent methyltransferase [Paenibacillus odorifer]